ncbi:TadE/TadG family type IV pilus assembly protein [Paraburkholderia ferrariae]|uniref:TadE/TadG family type IV pilus assembly protein n=1 Tax=Paraburkholderia ferrariae TaxID=386056 RepID=UPI0006945C1E|nr:TadE/TadG family type IV pilus assembly protein [Paraburkholderia ferrariae]
MERGRSGTARARRKEQGAAVVEFAIIAPFVVMLVIGVAQFGWYLANYAVVASAASTGARYFAAQRGVSQPYSLTQSTVSATMATLNATTSNVVVTSFVNDTQCASMAIGASGASTGDSTCATALSAAQGGSSTVTVTYSFAPFLKSFAFGLASGASSMITSSVSVNARVE